MTEKFSIVGIGGVSRSGKDTLAKLLIDEGYFGVSLGDITRDFATERHKTDLHPISRTNLTETSNWLRETRGPDVLMQITLERYQEARKKKIYKGLLAWSIRAPIEVDFILSHGGELIWIDVNDQVRYARAMADLREGEPKLSLEDYLTQENTQFVPQPGIPKEIQMDLPYVRSHATRIIENNHSEINDFYIEGHKLVKELKD